MSCGEASSLATLSAFVQSISNDISSQFGSSRFALNTSFNTADDKEFEARMMAIADSKG